MFKKIIIVGLATLSLFGCTTKNIETVKTDEHIHHFNIVEHIDKTDVHFIDFLEDVTNSFWHVEDYTNNYVMYMNDDTDDTVTVFYTDTDITAINVEFYDTDDTVLTEKVKQFYNIETIENDVSSDNFLNNELVYKYSENM